MRPSGAAGRLFEAFSQIAARAFVDDRLLSCQTLCKGPDQGQALRRFVLREPPKRTGLVRLFLLAARYIAANTLHFCFMLLTALFARLHGWQSPLALRPEETKPLLLIDTFAVLPRVAADNAWKDLYLPGLAQTAHEQGQRPLTLYRLYGSRSPFTLWQALGVLAHSGPGLLETHLLAPADWLRLARHILLYPLSLLRLVRSLDGAAPDAPERYIREALIDTAGQCVLVGEARRLAAFRLGLTLERGAHIVSWYENQSVNKAFNRGLSQAKAQCGRHVPVTGAQLFLWPPALLNNQADDAEVALGLTPDRVLVNGPHFLPVSSCQDYAVGPSLRYAHLFADKKKEPRSDSGSLLVLLSYHPEENRRVLDLTRNLSAGPFAAQDMIFRFHPATCPGDYADLLPREPRLSTGPLAEALAGATAVMGAGSGALAEAAALGLPVLAIVDEHPELGLNYLPPFGKGLLWESAGTPQQAATALRALLDRLDEPDRDRAVLTFRDLLFTRPTPELLADLVKR
ncbi:hypothetical protein LJC09_01315 [Desulfovibrio sp. OttesenSCG-928-F20]|nr:hypothetical protein [Desulfovibrio sp. OttesenSCG-928-F20]